MKKFFCTIACLLVFCMQGYSQSFATDIPERLLKGKVKQLDEFMARFNREESWDGKKPVAQDAEAARKSLVILLDQDRFLQANHTLHPLAEDFIKAVLDSACHLRYEDSTWVADVLCQVKVKEKKHNLRLILQPVRWRELEYVWTIKQVSGSLFEGGNGRSNKLFLSPVEHDVGFVGLLSKQYEEADVSSLFGRDYRLDSLSMLAALLQTGCLTFETIDHVSFHFYSLLHWVFTVERKEKAGSYNTGWLITKIQRL